MTEQPLDFKASLKAVWRQRLLVGVVALLGLIGGIGYGVLHPPMSRSVALVLLPQPSLTGSTTPVDDTSTQIILATSNPVLTKAGKSVSPPLDYAQLKRNLTVKALSEQILQIEVSARNASDAEKLASAVAAGYVHYVTVDLPSGLVGSVHPSVIPTPATALAPSKLRIPMLGAVGMAIGLLVGFGLALIRTSRDHRLRLRDEISGALGVPVLASLEAERYRTAAQWEKLLERWQPPSVVSWNLRRVLYRVAPVGARATQEVRVVSFTDDRAALAAGPQLATFAAALGIPTALVADDDERLVTMRAACAASERSGRSKLVAIGAAAGSQPAPGDVLTAGAELVVSVVVVDRSHPELASTSGSSLLSVSAASSNADELARLALAAADASFTFDGILVINPDPHDTTTGAARGVDTPHPMWLRRNGNGLEAPVSGWSG